MEIKKNNKKGVIVSLLFLASQGLKLSNEHFSMPREIFRKTIKKEIDVSSF